MLRDMRKWPAVVLLALFGVLVYVSASAFQGQQAATSVSGVVLRDSPREVVRGMERQSMEVAGFQEAAERVPHMEPIAERQPPVREIPERYRLPEILPGMTKGDFLAEYWGPKWPEVREALGGDRRRRSFDQTMLRKDNTLPRPIGTIADFFDGLEERTIAFYRQTNRVQLFYVPGCSGASYLDPPGILDSVLSSTFFNPNRKNLSENARLSLGGLIEETAILPTERAESLSKRWEQVLRECVRAIVVYEQPPIGAVSLAPMSNNANLLPEPPRELGVYPLQFFSLPYVDATDAPTSGGGFSGILRIWPGDDPLLRKRYDDLHIANEQFQETIQGFIESLPQ